MNPMTADERDPISFFPPSAPYPASAWPQPQAEPPPSLPPMPQPKKKRGWMWAIPAFVIALFVGGLVAASLGHKSTPTAKSSVTTVSATTVPKKTSTPVTSVKSSTSATTVVGAGKLAGPSLDIKALIAKLKNSVVAIEIAQGSTDVAAGSGVVVSTDGLIVTNAHVVALTDQFGRTLRNASVNVKLNDGSLRKATILGTDPSNDIAVIKVDDASGLVAAEIGNSDSLEVGDDVVAIGNALNLGSEPTVTKGIISATNRSLPVDDNLTLDHLLQTDAAINHGNSGGALVNASGQVIGINSAGIPDAQNLGFAIASNTFLPLIDQLKSGTQTPAASVLGVTTQQTVDGILVTVIGSGSGAEAAGIKVGDIITAVDGKPVAAQSDLGAAIRTHKPGETIKVTYNRNGQLETATATLGAR